MTDTRHPALAGLLAAVAALAALVGPSLAQEGATGVVVATVEFRDLAETAPVIGRVVASTEAVIAVRVPGVVDAVLVEVGDSVEAGAVIARLDDELLEIERRSAAARLEEFAAGLDVAGANMRLAEMAYDRIDRLRGSAAFSQGRYDDAASERTRAAAQQAIARSLWRGAQTALDRAEYNLRHTVVAAPFSGVVVERIAQPGEYVTVGQPVIRLLDASDLEIEADVPAGFAGGMAPGVVVPVRFGDGVVAEATVRTVIPRETIETQTRPVRFRFDRAEAPAQLAASQSVTLQIPISAPRRALTAPKDALTQGPRGWMAFAAVNGVAEPRAVEIGGAVGDRFEIRSGLADGDLVVVRGNERLRPGQPIAPTLEDGTPVPAPEAGVSPAQTGRPVPAPGG